MKKKSLALWNVSMWRRVWLLAALCIFIFSGFALGQTKITKTNGKRVSKSAKQKALFLRRKRKASRKQVARFQPPKTEEEFEGDPEKREEWFMRERTYPFDKIPDDARRRAWLSRPRELSSLSTVAQQTWRFIGPKPTTSYFMNNWNLTSGRINAIAVSPANSQLVLVGSATGGVWRSIDGGTNFSPVSDSQVDLAVGSIVFAPSNPNIVYAGMGDKASSSYLGSGVLKSTDAGQTWTRVSNSTLPAPGQISKIEVDPTDPNRVYVAQYSQRQGNSLFASGFWYSTDGGVNWTRTINGLARDLVRHPTEAQTLFLTMGRVDPGSQQGGIFKSIDGGLNWTRIYTAPTATSSNIKVAVFPQNPDIIYVWVSDTPRPRLEVTTNGGTSWTNLGSSTLDVGQFSYNCYVFVHPTDSNTVFVGTRDLWRSTDGGVNFTNITKNFTVAGGYTPSQSTAHPDQHHMYISPTDPNLIYIANDGGVWRSTNGAASFQTLNATLGLTMFVSLAVHPTDASRSYGGTQDNGTQRRTSATGWGEFATGDGGQTVIDPVDPSIIYVTYVGNSVFRYINNGSNFSATIGNNTIFNNDRVAFYPPLVGHGVDSKIYFGTYRLYVSTNRGQNWTAPGGTQDLTNGGNDVLSTIGVSPSDTNVIYTGSSQGRVMVTTNGGTNWNPINTGLPTRFIKSIIVHPTNPAVAYLTVSGYDTGHVFKTTNSGTTWTDISNNLPNTPTNTLLIDPRNPNTLYVGTDIGVYVSQNDGATWAGLNDGLPPVIITELVAQPRGLIQASTYGRGAYELPLLSKPPADFDGDGKTDLSVFRLSTGVWWLNQSSDGVTKAYSFGNSTDRIVPADYDGDGKTDVAFWRPSTGEWFVLRSSNLTFYSAPFGAAGDLPAPGDFDGDGRADFTVFRPSNGTWYINQTSDGIRFVPFGTVGDVPTVGDYDGDGKADVAIFRPSNGSWWMSRSTAGFFATVFGSSQDKPVQADYTGDGKTDIAFWSPSNGYWYVLRSEDYSYYAAPFGTSGDIPVPGDYDADARSDFAVFRPSGGTWFIQRSTQGTLIQAFGLEEDRPAPAAFVP